MKVLHLVGLKEDRGGVLSVIRNLQEVTGTDIDHVVWMSDGFEQTRTPRLEVERDRWAIGEGASNARYLAAVVPAARSVARLAERRQFDVIHAHTRGTLMPAVRLARRGWPVVFTNHNYAHHPGLYRWASRRPGMNTVLLSDSMAAHYGISVDAPGVRIIPAFCSDRFFDAPLARSTSTSDRPIRLTGLGMVVRWKGWHTLCEAMIRLDEADRERLELVHYGTHPDRRYSRELRELVRQPELTKRVRFEAATDDVAAALGRTDWLVHPAVQDPFPVVVMEALALGVPALVTNSGGPPDVVRRGESGLIFEPGAVDQLAEHLRTIARGEATMADRRAIRNSVTHLRASAVAARYVALYHELAGTHEDLGHRR